MQQRPKSSENDKQIVVGKQEHKEKNAAVILAAGSGRRMNTPVAKQFLDLMGIPVF